MNTYEELDKGLKDLLNNVDELNSNFDQELLDICNEEYTSLMNKFDSFELLVLLNNDYDHSNAILEIHPGAGGTESQDWAQMLFRMYQRYAQSNGYGFEVLSYEDGDEAGIKSCSVLIKGDLAYAYLKGESGEAFMR